MFCAQHTDYFETLQVVAFFMASVEIFEVFIPGTPMPKYGKCSFYLIFVFLSYSLNYC